MRLELMLFGCTIGAAIIVATASMALHAEATVTLQAGTARVVITPEKPRTTVMGTMPTGNDHDLFARALVLNDGTSRLVFVTYDLNCLDVATPLLRKRCRDELKLDPSRLILLATHNHQAPIQIVPRNFDYGEQLADKLFRLIEEAISNESGPVQVSFGFGNGYFVRSVGNAPVDYEVQLLKVTRGGDVVAMLFNHPTHPLQSSRTRIDVGHPGYAVDFVESKMPGTLAMYADACGGNQFPDRGNRTLGSVEQVKALGNELADTVLKIGDGKMQDVTGPLSSALKVISLPLAEPMPLEKAKELAEREKVPLDIGFVPYPEPDRPTNWIRALLNLYEKKVPFPKTTDEWICTDDAYLVKDHKPAHGFPCQFEEVIVARIGPLAFLAMQGEVCAPIGMRIKDALRREMPLMVFSYMGEHNLYIPTRELVRLDAYQAQVLRIQYACPVGWHPDVEDKMVEGVIDVVRSVMNEKPEAKVEKQPKPEVKPEPKPAAKQQAADQPSK